MIAKLEVEFICPDCGAGVERIITPVRDAESFACVAPCGHQFLEPAGVWEIATDMLEPRRFERPHQPPAQAERRPGSLS